MFSFFIKDKAMFGGYPLQQNIKEFEKNGVTLFVNLTQDDEKNLKSYTTSEAHVWRFRITDQKYPTSMYKYCNFVSELSKYIDTLQEHQKVYVHCRGGHGRSGLLVASLLIYRNKCSIEEGLRLTNMYHRERQGLSEKWHKIRIPNHVQINYLYKLFNPIIILNKPFIYKSTLPSLLYKTSIFFGDEETFTYNSGAIAFYAYKDLSDAEYILGLNMAKTFHTFMKIVGTKEWNVNITFENKVNRLVKILSFLAVKDFNHFQTISSLTEIYSDIFAYEFPCSQNVIGTCYKIVLLTMHKLLLSRDPAFSEEKIKFYD